MGAPFGSTAATQSPLSSPSARRPCTRRLAAARRSPPASLEALLWPDGSPERPTYFAMVLRGLGIPPPEIPSLLETLRAHNQEDCLWRVLEPDTPEVLDALRARGFVLGVISNADG